MTTDSGGEARDKSRRYLVVGGLFVLSLITYVDRAAISTAKGPMAAELSLSDREMGAVFSAFALGYAAAQIPSGWLADRLGPRRALAMVVVLWSLLTSLTGAMSTFGPLLAVRFLFGVAEAGAFPGSARVSPTSRGSSARSGGRRSRRPKPISGSSDRSCSGSGWA